jgi:peptidoglycan-associated lipoprotein
MLAGCPKKPARPDPSATMMGMTPSNSSSQISDLSTSTLSPDLAMRDNGFDPNTGQNRSALAAQTVYFDFDGSAIKASERTKLQAAKDYLTKNPGQRLLLEGHCDWRGTAEYNLGLGDRRAAAVKKYLVSIGVPADRMETLSKGNLEASKNADDATMAKDRRVDLVVVQPGAPGAALPMGTAGTGAATTPPPAGATPPPGMGGL